MFVRFFKIIISFVVAVEPFAAGCNVKPIEASEGVTASLFFEDVEKGDLRSVSSKVLANNNLVRLNDRYGNTALHLAAFRGNVEIVRLLVESGSVIDSKNVNGETPLLKAASRGDKLAASTVKYLLTKGASPNLGDKNGFTALHAAVMQDPKIMLMLIEHGADINAERNAAWTPLHEAVDANANVELVSVLLLFHPKINSMEGSHGHTPLHRAALNGNVEVIDLLLKNGANSKSRTKEGLLASDLAQQKDHHQAYQILKSAESLQGVK